MSGAPQPKVAIIVVSRNRRIYLEELLTSLIRQTFTNFELILVENASRPETRDFVVNLQLPFPLKKVLLEQEQTVSYCRNYPFEHNLISHDVRYIYFIDDDDAIFSYSLKAMVNRMERTGAQIVYSSSVRVYCTGKMLEKTYRYIRFNEEFRPFLINFWRIYVSKLLFPDKRWLFVRHINSAIAIHSLLFDIELFKKHRFQKDITYGEDSLLYFDMGPSVKRVSSLPYVFALYRRHGNNCGDPHNFAIKVRANPLSLDFCWGHYTPADCYMIFFKEYVDYRKKAHKLSTEFSDLNDPAAKRFNELALQTPASIKAATVFLYPSLSVRYALFVLLQRSKSFLGFFPKQLSSKSTT